MEFRVTKYDPARRLPNGSYGVREWTGVGDVGRPIDGHALTVEGYLSTEDKYVEAVRVFVEAAGVEGLVVRDLERTGVDLSLLPARLREHSRLWEPYFEEGAVLDGDGLDALVRLALREVLWCRVEGPDGFFVHFGSDFYMYVGGASLAAAPPLVPGIFAEPMRSPYHREGEHASA
jgi:hypothetical protein